MSDRLNINDTIAAIGTAVSNNAISIIKVSGPESIKIVDKVFSGSLKNTKSHTIKYGYILENNEKIDEVLVSVFKSPRSFTTEDVVEINCHGGIFVTNKILELVLEAGARLAEPGEFTKRAFINGRIDLTQAESVMDMIESNTKSSLKLAANGLLGETKKLIKRFREDVLNCLLAIEVNIDYPEYEDEVQVTNRDLRPQVEGLIREIDKVLEKSEVSRLLKNGIDTAIIGKPNVGKSSLLNSLLREDKAIVTDIEGTTRDIVEGKINIGGLVLNLIDTAGVRKTDNVVEKIGVDKSKKVLKDAELIILVLDNSKELNETDRELIKLTEDKNRIIVINKKDLESKMDKEILKDYLLISSFDEDAITQLENKIKEVCKLGDLNNIDATYIGNARQIAKLKEAKRSLQESIESLDNNMPIDIAGISIKEAWLRLGEILGEENADDMIDELFSRFCLGK